jgi:hypothetical protein
LKLCRGVHAATVIPDMAVCRSLRREKSAMCRHLPLARSRTLPSRKGLLVVRPSHRGVSAAHVAQRSVKTWRLWGPGSASTGAIVSLVPWTDDQQRRSLGSTRIGPAREQHDDGGRLPRLLGTVLSVARATCSNSCSWFRTNAGPDGEQGLAPVAPLTVDVMAA